MAMTWHHAQAVRCAEPLLRGPWARAAHMRGGTPPGTKVGLQLAAGFCAAASAQLATSHQACCEAAETALTKTYAYVVAPTLYDPFMPSVRFRPSAPGRVPGLLSPRGRLWGELTGVVSRGPSAAADPDHSHQRTRERPAACPPCHCSRTDVAPRA